MSPTTTLTLPEASLPNDTPVRRLAPVQPRTMVEQAAEAVVAAAARGAFLPGDRLVEAEIARDLGISRVPVREALRLLESQGIVVSTPYKGMRLMQVTNRAVAELTRVRTALETVALKEIAAARRASGNDVLYGLWLGLSRQLVVVGGIGQGGRSRVAVVAEHRRLLDCLAAGDAAGAQVALDAHLAWHEAFDFEGAIEARRVGRR